MRENTTLTTKYMQDLEFINEPYVNGELKDRNSYFHIMQNLEMTCIKDHNHFIPCLKNNLIIFEITY